MIKDQQDQIDKLTEERTDKNMDWMTVGIVAIAVGLLVAPPVGLLAGGIVACLND